MSIVTRTGDKGETGLFGSQRVSKSDPRMDAIGTVDELNAALGCIRAQNDLPQEIEKNLERIQNELFRMGADLATVEGTNPHAKRMTADHVIGLERVITEWENILPPLTAFILPSGSTTGSWLHLARAISRRAERCVVTLAQEQPLNIQIQIYLNRLSDLLFLLARAVNREKGAEETPVRYE